MRGSTASLLIIGAICVACAGPTAPAPTQAPPTTTAHASPTPTATVTATASPATSPSAVASPTLARTATVAASGTPTAGSAPPSPSGPPTGSFTATGDPGLDGELTPYDSAAPIRCEEPTFDGLAIDLLTVPPAGGNLLVKIVIHPPTGGGAGAQVSVRLAGGSATQYQERDFVGDGVTNFDAAVGATIDTALTEAPSTAPKGNLGAITALKGTVACNGQTAGTSAIQVTGSVNGLVGPVSPAVVSCSEDATGAVVSLIGLIGAETPTPWMVVITMRTTGVSFVATPKTGALVFLKSDTPVAVTGTGASIDQDTIEQNSPAGAPPRMEHLAGTATCGAEG